MQVRLHGCSISGDGWFFSAAGQRIYAAELRMIDFLRFDFTAHHFEPRDVSLNTSCSYTCREFVAGLVHKTSLWSNHHTFEPRDVSVDTSCNCTFRNLDCLRDKKTTARCFAKFVALCGEDLTQGVL